MLSSRNNLVALENEDLPNPLINLKLPDVLCFHNEIATCLVELTPGKESEYQPQGSIVNRPVGDFFSSPSLPQIVRAQRSLPRPGPSLLLRGDDTQHSPSTTLLTIARGPWMGKK